MSLLVLILINFVNVKQCIFNFFRQLHGLMLLQIKAVVINDKLHVKHEESVKFDDLKTYCTNGGFHVLTDGLTVTAPTIMWVEVSDYHNIVVFETIVYI